MRVVRLQIAAGAALWTAYDDDGTEPVDHKGIARMPVSRARLRRPVMIAPRLGIATFVPSE
jgi:hypothetical protein